MLKTGSDSVCAGILIALGGSVFLACENGYVGACLFSVALLCICYFGYSLYTGKIGYVVFDHQKKNLYALALCLLINLIVTFLLGLLLRSILQNLGERASALILAKLEQSFLSTFVRAIFCGILMYLAVEIFKSKQTPIGILFCIPVFILSGFEHSIADMFYFGMSGIFETKMISFEIAAILGNTIGSMILPLLAKVGRKNAE